MTTTERPSVTLRPFTEGDYVAYVELANEAYPDYGWTIAEVRHFDDDWKPEGYHQRRIIAEEGGVPVGYSDVSHSRGQFAPDNYNFDVIVRPAARRRGIGTALFEDALAALRARRPHWARNQLKESNADSVAFAKKIGAVELRRDWESRLDPAARLDVPSLDPPTPSPYERFEEEVLRSPFALPEAHFIAIRDGRYVGECAMGKEGTDPGVVYQHLTAVLRDERGKGIAMALKLKTVEYARANGIREIKTWNDQRNRPMLRINEAMGFAKQPAWIEVRKDLSPST